MDRQVVDISTLKNWDKNPRSIKKEDFERLKNQIKKLGIYKPLLINKEGIVLGGNMRLRAYKDLGIKEVEVNIVDADTEAKMLEYALSDNDRAGYWDEQDLAELLTQNAVNITLDDYKIDLGNTSTLQDLLNQFGPDVEEDEPPPLPEEAISKYGEIYQLGRHRLMCGDATKIEDVEKLMDGKTANVLITDPPYGVDYSGKNRMLNEHDRGNRIQEDIENDDSTNYREFFATFLINLKSKFDNVFYVFINGRHLTKLVEAIEDDCKYKYSADLIWVKNNHVLGRLDYNKKHETIIYGWQNSHKFFGGFQTSVINYDKPMISDLHPTMKPVGLLTKLIKDSTLENNIVLDVFGGSGSTLIACEQTNRICYMMELDPKYCDVIRQRYENYIENKKETTNGESQS